MAGRVADLAVGRRAGVDGAVPACHGQCRGRGRRRPTPGECRWRASAPEWPGRGAGTGCARTDASSTSRKAPARACRCAGVRQRPGGSAVRRAR
ncbi:MAG: hypothetical protein MZW92_39605 [Comamonadaceae bacterium]|nr:hypothetical protein [Comamonadaceae bacterium]